MIKKVSALNSTNPLSGETQKNNRQIVLSKKENVKEYCDSFIKNAAQSTPFLLACTAVLSASDKAVKEKEITIQTAWKNNLKEFFLPVVIASSILIAVVENKKTSKNQDIK